jgi:hypothetical protein
MWKERRGKIRWMRRRGKGKGREEQMWKERRKDKVDNEEREREGAVGKR